MNLLFRILYAQKCSSTHHRLAMDALRYLRASDSERWQQLFLAEVEQYLDGAKAPDRKFRDFRNHVLHVSDNYWGGAVTSAELWYGRLVECLRGEDWRRAAYCAGVLSHYISDPFMPLHTAQSEDEGAVHRLLEWGTSRSYRDLVATLPAARGIQNWKPPAEAQGSDWLALLIIEGATRAHQSYDVMIDHYCPVRGQKNAADGMDTDCRETIAHLLGRCIRALACVLDRAIEESAVVPPRRALSVATVLSGMSTPVFVLTRRLASRQDRMTVKAILKELRETGRVIDALPEDDRVIRSAHAEEVLGVDADTLRQERVRRPGTQFRIATPEEKRERRLRRQQQRQVIPAQAAAAPRLAPRHDVVDAPSIGPKTADRLKAIGIRTVGQLLDADVPQCTAALRQRWITEELFESWQRQAALVCAVPGMRGMDAQLLVGVGIGDVEELRHQDVQSVLELIHEYAATDEGERIVRSSRLPDRHRVDSWIQSAAAESRRVA